MILLKAPFKGPTGDSFEHTTDLVAFGETAWALDHSVLTPSEETFFLLVLDDYGQTTEKTCYFGTVAEDMRIASQRIPAGKDLRLFFSCWALRSFRLIYCLKKIMKSFYMM